MAKAPRITKTRVRRKSTQASAKWANPIVMYLLALALALAAVGYAVSGWRTPATANGPLKKAHRPPPGRVWKMVETANNGKGVVATRDLAAGELIILDLPLLRIPATENRTEAVENLARSYALLTPADRADYMTLAHSGSKLSENHTVGELVVNIFESNAVRAGQGEAVFKHACRINHSCMPNADYFYRDDLEALTVHAVRDIKAGAEIFCPYFDAAGHTFIERQEYLHNAYDFECQCEVCSLGELDRDESDTRRNRISELREVIIGWTKEETEPEEAVAAVDEALTLMRVENYWSSLGSWAANAMQISAAHQDEASVKKWAEIAADRYAIETGDDSPQTLAIRTIRDNPHDAQAWAQRNATVLPVFP